MIPADELSIEKKGFTWDLEEFSSTKMGIQIYFENPSFISAGSRPDKLTVSFYNTTKYLEPEDPELSAVPDGYQLSLPIPMQERIILDYKMMTENGQAFVAGNIILAFLLKDQIQRRG